MEKQDFIILIESDEISLFLAQSLLEGLQFDGSARYFTEAEEGLAFIKALSSSSVHSLSLFVSTKVIIGEKELMKQFREVLNKFPSRVCLLSSVEGPSGEEKEYIEKMGVTCTVEKPLTEEKLLDAFQENGLFSVQDKNKQ